MNTWGKGWTMSLRKSEIIFGKGGVSDEQCYHCVETIFGANQRDGFYVMLTLAWNGNIDVWLRKYQSLVTSYCFQHVKLQPGRWFFCGFGHI